MTEAAEKRFWARVNKNGPAPTHRPALGPCWIWIPSPTANHYGRLSIDGVMFQAHRYSWEILRGEIPAGLEIDHLCRTPSCVRPDHMEIVTHKINSLRSIAPPAINAAKTECIRGHQFDTANTILRPDGKRACLICHRNASRERERRYRIRRKAQKLSH
jgi:hypothetical protein